jgi:hypothetical protein
MSDLKSRSYELKNVNILYGRFLFYEKIEKEDALPNPIQIPFGSVAGRKGKGHKFFLRLRDTNELALVAIPDNSADNEIQILPKYSWQGNIDSNIFGKVGIKVQELHEDVERVRAMGIVLRSHYLNAPTRGLILGCWFTNTEQQKEIRKYSHNKMYNDQWSDSWQEPMGNMVGCAVLDTLYHGIPSGRRKIAEKEGLKDLLKNWKEADRVGIINQLKVAWASRFAIDAPYRSIGLGELLAHHLAHVAYAHRLPRAKYVEVITTEPLEQVQNRLKQPTSSFLVRAGYTLNSELYHSRKMPVPDATGNRQLQSARKLYYFIKTGPA